MLKEIAIGGMLFSPLVICIPLAMLLTWLLQRVLHWSGLRAWLWKDAMVKEAWFDISLFILFLALTVALAGRY